MEILEDLYTVSENDAAIRGQYEDSSEKLKI